MTADDVKRMRELQRKDGLTRAEHRELDKLEDEFDKEVEDDPKEDPPKEDPPKEDPPKDPPKEPPKEDPPKEDPPKEDPPKDPPKPASIKPENDHWWFKKRFGGRV